MFLCAICGLKSQRNEAPILVLQEVRVRQYRNERRGTTTMGWEIKKEGPVSPSHKHGLKWNEMYKRFIPYVGFKVTMTESAETQLRASV